MTKQEILEHSLTLFMKQGYEGASMSDIASATGIKKASLYAHYSGKEEIFSAVFSGVVEEYRAMMQSLTLRREDESALTRLERMFRAFLRYCHENERMYFWDRYFYYPPAFMREEIQQKTLETQQVFLDRITAVAAEGVRRGELREQPPEKLALAFYYLMIGLSMSVSMYTRAALQTDVQSAWNALRPGLALPESSIV